MKIELKIQNALADIELALSKHQRPVVACSFGKDSEVTLHLIRQVRKTTVVFNNTLVENPDTLKFKNRLVKEWDLNLVEIKPLNGWTFWKVVEKYGFPIGQRRGATATGKCCYYLKKAPMKKAMKEYEWDLIIDGMTIYESRQRYLNLKESYRYNHSWECYKLSPIVDWTPNDVWDYIEKYNLPYNAYYDKELDTPGYTKRGYRQQGYYRCLRVGCWACTIPLKYDPSHLIHLRKYYPKLHKLLLAKGLGEYLLKYGKNTEIYQNLGAKWITENRPCYFDGVVLP